MSLDTHLQDFKTPSKLLSILTIGRNDNYMGNFKWRLSTVLNAHARNIMYLGLEKEVELLVGDWGSETPLYEALDLTAEAKLLTKFLIVPPDIAKEYDKDSGFAAICPVNAIGRRAKGKYLMFADSDVFITVDAMTKLMYHLRKGYIHNYSLEETFFWGSKYHVPYDLVKESPTLEKLDEHIEKNWQSYATEMANMEKFSGGGVTLLMTKEMWFDSRGWDESLIYWGWNDIDWHIRLAMRYRWHTLERHGMKMFHLEHYKDRHNAHEAENPRKQNEYIVPTWFTRNPDNWGLSEHNLNFVDGYGLEVLPSEDITSSTFRVRFPTEYAPLNVNEITSINPLYQGLQMKLDFNAHNFFGNKKELESIISKLAPVKVLEVGTWLGGSARFFAACPSVQRVYCVDPWDKKRSEPGTPDEFSERLLNNMYEQFLANCLHTNTAQKIYPVRLNSTDAAAYLKKHGLKFDLIYLDGEHSTYGVKRDLALFKPLLTPNGVICGDDWTWQTEPNNVAGGVASFAADNNLDVFAEGNFWIVLPKPPR